jgi:RNA polymerase sigma-70 factor (sigma-E family)
MATSEERRAAFDTLLETRSPALLAAACLLTGNRAAGEDLLQTALAKTWVKWGSLHDPAAAEAYVRRVMVTTYSRWWRRRWNGELATDDLPEPRREGADDSFGQVEDRHRLGGALAALPRRQRAVVVLRFYCDLSEAETASALGVSTGTVKSQASKGLAALRLRLAPAPGPVPGPVPGPSVQRAVLDLRDPEGAPS